MADDALLDTSPRREEREEDRDTDPLLRWSFDQSPFALAIYDTEGRFLRVNEPMTKQLAASRVEAQSRLVEEAEAKGGNAIVAFRFDTSELGSTWTEICAYGTAVRARRA